MYKYISYLWLSLAVLFLQIFFIDNINLGASMALWIRPMLFPLIVLLLPMEWKPIWVIIVAYIVGNVMDLSLGGEGLYVATLLPMALIRPWIVYVTTRRSVEVGEQKQLLARLNTRQLMLYIGTALLIHHTLFFLFEALSLSNLFGMVLTIILTLMFSMLLGWFIIRIFVSKVLVQ